MRSTSVVSSSSVSGPSASSTSKARLATGLTDYTYAQHALPRPRDRIGSSCSQDCCSCEMNQWRPRGRD
jgi:hypothetical protein